MNLTLYSVISVLILDSDGQRVFANYYSAPHTAAAQHHHLQPPKQPYTTLDAQTAFEKGLFDKTKKQSTDVILYDGHIVVYKTMVDCTIYVVGGMEESELMLYQAVVALKEALEITFKYVRYLCELWLMK